MLGIVIVLLFNGGVSADEQLPDSGESRVDAWHDMLAERVVLTAERLDSFFQAENYRAEANTTSFTLSLSSFFQQGDDADINAKARLRLRLPHLENRAMFFIGGSGEDLETTDSLAEATESAVSGSDKQNLTLGLRYFFRDDERSNLSFGGGLRFRSGSPVVFVEPRYRYFRSFPSFDARFVQRFRWFSDDGLESRTELQLERPVWETWFFRALTRVDWYEDEEEDGFFPQLGFLWARPIDEHRVFTASWNNYFLTEPQSVLDSSVVGVRYRQQTWRRWLWFEVAPQVAFTRDEDYDATPGLFLKLEAEFER
jgi:hypothetical protein